MRISDLLERKGTSVATITGGATVGEAVAELARLSIGALVVSPDGVHIEGIVSERDVVRQLHSRKERLVAQPVSTIMSADVHTCTLDDSVEAVMALMTERRVRHVP